MYNFKYTEFEDVRICFRNFSGAEGRFNPAGRRNFCLLLPPDRVDEYIRNGWTVKYLNPRNPGDDPQPYIQVTVSYRVMQPKVILINSNGKKYLDESTINVLDFVDIERCSVSLTGSKWEMNGKTGVKAYLKTIAIVVKEDAIEKMYADDNKPEGISDTFVPVTDDDVPF